MSFSVVAAPRAEGPSRQLWFVDATVSLKGQTPFLKRSTRRPLSWHIVLMRPRSLSKSSLDAHQSGPPGFHWLKATWFDPGTGVVAPGGLK